MGNCVGKGSAAKDKEKAPYTGDGEEGAAKPEVAPGGEAAPGEAAAATTDDQHAGQKAVGEDKAGMEDIPLADEDPDEAVKEGDIKVQVGGEDAPPARPPSPPPRSDTSPARPAATVTVKSMTTTQETKDEMSMPTLGEPLDPETIISNIRAKTQGTGITMASQSKTTVVTKTVDASGKEVVNVETKETSYEGAPPDGAEGDADNVKSKTQSYTFETPSAEISKEGGQHVLVTSTQPGEEGTKDEMALFGALKLLKDSAEGLEATTESSVVSETVHSTVTKSHTHSVQTVETTAEGVVKVVNDSGPLEQKVEQTLTQHNVIKVEGGGAVNGVMEPPQVTVSAASREGSPDKQESDRK